MLFFFNRRSTKDKRPPEDGLCEHADGTKIWYRNGQLHRQDGPAVETSNGDKEWWRDGKRHREGGPAIETAEGRRYYYLHGKLVSSQNLNPVPKRNTSNISIQEELANLERKYRPKRKLKPSVS